MGNHSVRSRRAEIRAHMVTHQVNYTTAARALGVVQDERTGGPTTESSDSGDGLSHEQRVGFHARTFVLASMPYQDPGDDTPMWHRRNGDFSLTVMSGSTVEGGVATSIGLPYGTVPRLLVAFLATEMVRRHDPYVELPVSPARFMRQLGMQPTGDGDVTLLRTQIERLCDATFTVRWDGRSHRGSDRRFMIARAWDLGWDSDSEGSGFIHCSEEFVDEVMTDAVPINLETFLAMDGGSGFSMDLLAWLTHRVTCLARPVTVPLESLSRQFGYPVVDDVDEFTSQLVEHLPGVLAHCPGVRADIVAHGLRLTPGCA